MILRSWESAILVNSEDVNFDQNKKQMPFRQKTTDRLKIKVKVKHTIYSLHMTSPNPFDNNGRGKI